jgi:hypothetical protein
MAICGTREKLGSSHHKQSRELARNQKGNNVGRKKRSDFLLMELCKSNNARSERRRIWVDETGENGE